MLAACCGAHAQTAQQPTVDDSPRFEIRRFVFDGATLIPRDALERDTRAFVGPQKSFADVQRALEVVERAYSSAGWSAVQVVLPEQELDRGEIRFQIIEARIGRVIVEGNKFFDEANVRASVPALEPGKAPNINTIARNLRIANESPAKQSQVLLRSGQEEATVDAVVRVVDESPVKRSITLDNTGSRATGKLRLGLGYQNANLSGQDDVLSLQFVTAPYEDHLDEEGYPHRLTILPSRKVTVIGIGYRLPHYDSGNSVDVLAGYSNVNSGTIANIFSITGAGTIFGVRYNQNLSRLGDFEHRLIYSFDWRTYDNKGVRAVGSTVQLIPDVTVHPIGVTYSGSLRKQDSETSVSLGYVKHLSGGNDATQTDYCKIGLRNNGLGQCASSTYELWRWSFTHNQALPADVQFRLVVQGQETKDMLVPGEMFGIGGAESVRGFLEREVADDYGHRVTAEVYGPDFGSSLGISGARARAVVFADWGHVKRINPAPGDLHAQGIGSFGIGLRFSRGSNLAFRTDYAVITDPGGGHTRDSSRVHFSFSYVF